MLRARRRTNPFYVLLIVIGISFTITACAYFVLALRGDRRAGAAAQAPSPLMTFMDRHGVTVIVAELALLAVTTVGAITTDDWWAGRDGGGSPSARSDEQPPR